MKPSQNLLTVQGKMRRIGLLKLAETLALLQDHRLMERVGTIGRVFRGPECPRRNPMKENVHWVIVVVLFQARGKPSNNFFLRK